MERLHERGAADPGRGAGHLGLLLLRTPFPAHVDGRRVTVHSVLARTAVVELEGERGLARLTIRLVDPEALRWFDGRGEDKQAQAGSPGPQHPAARLRQQWAAASQLGVLGHLD